MNDLAATTSDLDLLHSYATRNDATALETLFARHADMAYRTALRITRNAADAEDAVQIAFVSILRSVRQYRGGECVGAWIAKYALNSAKNLVRGAVRRRAREENVAKETEPFAAGNSEETNDLALRVRSMLDAMPERYRMPVWLHHYEGLSFGEVGRTLELSEVTARSYASRGLAMLREKLARAGMPVPVASVAALFGSMSGESAPTTLTRSLGLLVESGGRAGLSSGARSWVARIGSQGASRARLAIAAAAVAAVAGTASVVALRNGKVTPPQAEERPWPSRYVPGPILFEKDFSEGLAGWSIMNAKAPKGNHRLNFFTAAETTKSGARILEANMDGKMIPVLEILVAPDSESKASVELDKDIEADAFSIEWTKYLDDADSGTTAAMSIPGILRYRLLEKSEMMYRSHDRGDGWSVSRAEFVPLPDSDPPGGMRVTQYRDDGAILFEIEAWSESKRAMINVERGRALIARVTVRELVPVWD